MYQEKQTLNCNHENLFDVVADVARYPEFLPGWDRVQVNQQPDGSLLVEQHVKFGPLSEHLRSIAWFDRPSRIVVEPDSHQKAAGVALEWHFTSLASGQCRVELQIEGRARNPVIRRLLNSFVHQASRDMIRRFTRRVEALYDEPCRIVK